MSVRIHRKRTVSSQVIRHFTGNGRRKVNGKGCLRIPLHIEVAGPLLRWEHLPELTQNEDPPLQPGKMALAPAESVRNWLDSNASPARGTIATVEQMSPWIAKGYLPRNVPAILMPKSATQKPLPHLYKSLAEN